MAESKPVNATTVERLVAIATFFCCTWHFITTFSRPKDTLLGVWVWKNVALDCSASSGTHMVKFFPYIFPLT